MKGTIFIRPTNTDGDSISVREALYFDIPCISSDVVPRPPGTIVFKNRNTDDLIIKIKDVLNNYDNHKNNLKKIKCDNNFNKIFKVYNEYI